MTPIWEIVQSLGYSDLSRPTPPEIQWAAVQGTHALLGIAASLLPKRWAVVCLALFALKEVCSDLPHANFAFLIVSDSIADLAICGAGFCLGKWMLKRGAAEHLTASDQTAPEDDFERLYAGTSKR